MGILTEDMKRVVREQRLGFIATVCRDGTPNLSPKGTTAVWDDDHLVFADLRSPQTISNLEANPAIEINVVDPLVRKGYRFKGRARIISRGQELERFVEFFARQPDGVQQAEERVLHAVIVEVDRALPLTSPAYELGLTEAEVLARWRQHQQELLERRADDGAT